MRERRDKPVVIFMCFKKELPDIVKSTELCHKNAVDVNLHYHPYVAV